MTLNGPIGDGGNEIGVAAARLLNADYVDRLVLAEAAKRMGSTVTALAEKERGVGSRKARLASFLETASMHFVDHGVADLPSLEYSDVSPEPATADQRHRERHYVEVTSTVIKELAETGNVVIIGRGSSVILKDTPGVLHVGLIAPLDLRIMTVAEREHFDWKDAKKYVEDMERARQTYLKKFFNVDAGDSSFYHMVLNREKLSVDAAAGVIAHAAGALASS